MLQIDKRKKKDRIYTFSSGRTYVICRVVFFILIWALGFPATASNRKSELDNKFVIELNYLTYKIAYEHDKFYSLIGIRSLTMVHLAIHDALNSIDRQYDEYAYFKPEPKADPIAASAQVACEILIAVYPERKDTIKSVLDYWLNLQGDKKAKSYGISLGGKIAQLYLELRSNDGHQKQGDYTPMSKPGDYQYTPGWNNWVLKPDFNFATPFAMDTVTQFRSPSPPDLSSEAYAASYNEVKNYGCKNSTIRTKDQTNIAHWWAEFAEHSWNRIGRITTDKYKLDPWQTARMFALINMDIYDIYLASLESKYYYDTWRPLTAIHEADDDGNPFTKSQPNWEPEMLTPPWPEYPSAHAAVGAGGAEIVSYILGTDEISFSMESTSALPDGKMRTYYNLKKAADDCAESRIMNGYHFRFATDEGKRQGMAIAMYIYSSFLLPIKKMNHK